MNKKRLDNRDLLTKRGKCNLRGKKWIKKD